MIPLTLLCLALFALAWGYRKAWKRAKDDAIVAVAMADDWAARGLSRSDFPRPMSCRVNTPRFDTVWLSEAALLRELGCGEVSE